MIRRLLRKLPPSVLMGITYLLMIIERRRPMKYGPLIRTLLTLHHWVTLGAYRNLDSWELCTERSALQTQKLLHRCLEPDPSKASDIKGNQAQRKERVTGEVRADWFYAITRDTKRWANRPRILWARIEPTESGSLISAEFQPSLPVAFFQISMILGSLLFTGLAAAGRFNIDGTFLAANCLACLTMSIAIPWVMLQGGRHLEQETRAYFENQFASEDT